MAKTAAEILQVNPLLPQPATIKEVISETAVDDVKTFRMVFDDPEFMESFTWRPGQCAMVSLLGVGECMFSICNSATRKEFVDFSVKRIGLVTNVLHEMGPGSRVAIRGPLGNSFPVEDWKGKNLIFIGGGIGLAPLRSIINYVMDKRDDYARVDIIYGARSPGDLCFKYDLFENWPAVEDTHVHVTVDKGDDEWTGPVGFVPPFLEEVNPSPENAIAITCGPPIMIKFVLQALDRMKYTDDQVFTTLEMKMQCGVGKCGRCNVGHKYICVDGPVFTLEELKKLPPEW